MKQLSKAFIAVILAILTAMVLPAQVFADSAEEKYISEVQIGVGKTASEAEKALAGYEILKDGNGNYVDLNKNAGATGTGGKGNRVVYMGIKRTSSTKDAVTDLAVMNMKGGYSVEDYDALMDAYIKEQINPFVDSFLATIAEYRENFNSANEANKQRATYIHDVLNKFLDDDTGKPLGDLLLNQTKYELGDEAYNALPDEKKKEHADIVTILAQANGRAVLALENLLTRAADPNSNTWLDRIVLKTYDDLLFETNLSASKAQKQLDRLYYDDAETILGMWNAFKQSLDHYDEALARLEEAKKKDLSQQEAIINSYDFNTATDAETEAYAKAVAEITANAEAISNAYADVVCKEYLETIEYDGGTLLDYFTMPSSEIEEDITVLYPLVDALTAGQRAGLEFTTLQELVIIGSTNEIGYKNNAYDDFKELSVYDGVDRGIYEKGGVGLTSDAYRQNAAKVAAENNGNGLSLWTYASIGLTSASILALGVTIGVKVVTSNAIKSYNALVASLKSNLSSIENKMRGMTTMIESTYHLGGNPQPFYNRLSVLSQEYLEAEQSLKAAENPQYLSRLEARSAMCNKLMVGFGIAMIILIGITTYLTYQDMVDRYKVNFTPIPRYMVDEKDIIAYNDNGDKIVLKNQAAYYKAVFCNRKAGDEMYKNLGNIADLNGDVGSQWLALYAARNEAERPILADSLRFTNSEEIPAGYKTGIHSFGTDAAENLNNTLYVWNSAAPKVFVYFKTEAAKASTTGSTFTSGTVALSGAAGLAVGALATALGMKTAGKRKKNKAAQA